MIFDVITGKALPYVAVATLGLILSLLAAVIWLYNANTELSEHAGQLDQANAQLAQVSREQALQNASLTAEMKRRDNLVTEAVRLRQQYAAQARKAEQELADALNNSECASQPHPATVGDWLRKHSDDH